MNKEIKTKWLKALRSDRFVQGSGELVYENEEGVCHCCLGVLCAIAFPKYDIVSDLSLDEEGYVLSGEVQEIVGLGEDQMTMLAHMNDSEGRSFKQIAQWVEENL